MGKEKNKINVVVVGHVDSGKSTTTGHLVLKCGGIDKRTIDKFEKEAAEKGKASFKYAWVLDKSTAERERGITIDQTLVKIETENNSCGICDAPGHKDFIKNMITGTAAADVVVLVVSLAQGEMEIGTSKSGQAPEHATLAFTMGCKIILVVMNKIDIVDNIEARYNEARDVVLSLLTKIGYSKNSIAFIPISGFCGDNISEPSSKTPWFKGWSYEAKNHKNELIKISGQTLLDWFNNLQPVRRPIDKPLRCPISDVYKIAGAGTVAVGRVESGTMKPNLVVYISPANLTTEIKTVEAYHQTLESAGPGDNVGFSLKNIAFSDVKRGCVVGQSTNDPPRQAENFTAQIVCISPIGKNSGFHVGYSPVLDCHTAHTTVRVSKVISRIDKRSGKAIVEDDESLAKVVKYPEAGMVEFTPKSNLCIEVFSQYPSLGRFAVRDSKMTVAVGVVKEVVKSEPAAKGAAGKAAPAAKGGAKKAAAPAKKK